MKIDDKIRDEKLQYDVNREKHQHNHLEKLINMNILQVRKYYLPPYQRRVIDQPKLAYSPLEKQTKTTEDQAEKQIKALEEHGKQLVEFNELVKKDFNIDGGSIPFSEQRKIFDKLVKGRSSEFKYLEKRINPDNLIYKYKIEEMTPKGFRNSQNPIELFKDLRDGNINPKEVLKDQINFKSDLCGIKKGDKKSKSKDQISVLRNVQNLFDLRENIIDLFRDYSFFAI